MPRVPGRDRTDIERLLEQAVGEAAAAEISRAHAKPVVDVTIDDVLDRVNQALDAQKVGRATKGAVFSVYPGGKSEMLRAGLAKYIGPDTGHAHDLAETARTMLRDGSPADDVFAWLAHKDVADMAEQPQWLRIYLAHHSRSADASATRALSEVYEAFDEIYLGLYQDLLRSSGRRLRDGIALSDLALAISAYSEGLALRLNGDDTLTPSDRERVMTQLAARGRQGILESMTESDVTVEGRDS